MCAQLASQPFQGINPDAYQDSQSSVLELVDSGGDGEIVPFGPLLVKTRQLDVIVAVDGSSDDTDNWPQ
jgi:lysophospholipase